MRPLTIALLSWCLLASAVKAECGTLPQPWRHAFSELCTNELKRSRHIENFPARLAAINAEVNKTEYENTDLTFGRLDYWATPSEFYQWGGLCREYSVAKYYRLAALGVAEKDMRIDIAVLKDGQEHAVLEVLYDGRDYVLDNRDNEIHEREYLDTMKVVFALNRQHIWKVVAN